MNWTTQSLKHLLILNDTGTWGDEGSPTSGVPVLRSTNIQDFQLILDNFAWRIVPQAHQAKKKLIDGDIIVTTSSGSPEHIGKCCIFLQPEDGWDYYFSNFTLRLRPDPNRLDSRWLYYWLSSPYGRAVLTSMNNTTSGLRNLDRQRYLDQRLPLPPLEEQRRIAAILDKADAVRRKRKEALALTEELLRSAFLDMFGDPVTNPKGWEIVELQQLCSVIVDCPHETPKYSESITPYPCIRSSDIQRGYIDLSTTKYVDYHHYKIRTKRHVPVVDDIIYCREGARFGNAALVPKDMNPCLGQRMMLLQADKSKAEPVFLCFLLNTEGVYLQAAKLVAGSASPHVNVGDIKKIKVFYPPRETQFLFKKIAEKNEFIRQKLLVSLETSNLNFYSLLQRAFRGEI